MFVYVCVCACVRVFVSTNHLTSNNKRSGRWFVIDVAAGIYPRDPCLGSFGVDAGGGWGKRQRRRGLRSGGCSCTPVYGHYGLQGRIQHQQRGGLRTAAVCGRQRLQVMVDSATAGGLSRLPCPVPISNVSKQGSFKTLNLKDQSPE